MSSTARIFLVLNTVIFTENNLQHVVKEIEGHKHPVVGALLLMGGDSPSQRSSPYLELTGHFQTTLSFNIQAQFVHSLDLCVCFF